MSLTKAEANALMGELRATIARYIAPEAQPTVGQAVAAVSNRPPDPDDPVVRLDPKRGYTGPSMVGRRFSECEPKYLGQLSHLLDWMADKNEGEGKAKYAAQDRSAAEAARKWRAKLEGTAGSTPPHKGVPTIDELADSGAL